MCAVHSSSLLVWALFKWNFTYCSCHTCPAHNACSFVCLTELSSPTPASTPTLSLSGSLLHIVGVLAHDISNGLNTTRRDGVPYALWVKPTPQLGKRCDKTGGGREVENKAECHSLTGVLTIMGCHHFLIRPVSEKCSNKTAVQRWPPPYCTHTHRCSETCYWCARTSHGDAQTDQTCQKSATYRPPEVVLYRASCCRDIPNKTSQKRQQWSCKSTADRIKGIFGASGKVTSVLSLIYVPLWPAISPHKSLRCSFFPEEILESCVRSHKCLEQSHLKEERESSTLQSKGPIIVLCPNRGRKEAEKWNNICPVIWLSVRQANWGRKRQCCNYFKAVTAKRCLTCSSK